MTETNPEWSNDAVPLDRPRLQWGRIGAGICIAVIGIAALTGSIFGVAWYLSNSVEPPEPFLFSASPASLPIAAPRGGYAGSASCVECHASEHASWHASYHRTMTQQVTLDSAVAEFSNVKLQLSGRDYVLGKDDKGPWVEFRNPPNPALAAYEIEGPPPFSDKPIRRYFKLSTGSHHMQMYWLSTGNDRELAVFPFVWLIEDQKWIPRRGAFLSPSYEMVGFDPDVATLHSFEVGRWNDTCIACHTTHGQHGNEPAAASRVAEFGISCEECHGPGQAHVTFHQHGNAGKGPEMVVATELDKERASEVCGQCHANWDLQPLSEGGSITPDYHPGEDLRALRDIPIGGTDPHYYWPDGMIRTAGDEFNGLLMSPCYAQGEMTCLSCHQLHPQRDDPRTLKEWADDQLKPDMRGNKACLQCHESYRDEADLASHTHHLPTSQGSQCYNCHMPHTTYGLLKGLRSHTIANPSAAETMQHGRPNACNACHLDKPVSWAGEYLTKWYQQDPPPINNDAPDAAMSIEMALRGDAAQRALIAWHMGWDPAREISGDEWMAPYLRLLLIDDYDAIRLIAHRSLRKIQGYADVDYDPYDPPDVRARKAEQIAKKWADKWSPPDTLNPALLITPEGELDRPRIDSLLNERDEQRVSIFE